MKNDFSVWDEVKVRFFIEKNRFSSLFLHGLTFQPNKAINFMFNDVFNVEDLNQPSIRVSKWEAKMQKLKTENKTKKC